MSEAAASTCGLINMGDVGNNTSIYDVGGGLFDGSLSIIMEGISVVGGVTRRRSFARRGFR